MQRLRPFRPADRDAVARICLRTADSGSDATGLLPNDGLWADLFVLPYVEREPELATVVADEADRAVGYVVGTADTRGFEEWFRTVWWPARAARWQEGAHTEHPGAARQGELLSYADARAAGAEPYADVYPAHLHIDLLPVAQGHGWGRALIREFAGAVRARGVAGLHLVAGADNRGALAFYDRIGMRRLESPEGAQAFALDLTPE